MTSSQTLLFNLFGPLSARSTWLLEVLSRVLSRNDFLEVIQWSIEYAPRRRSEYLGDMTRVDLLVVVETRNGRETVVVEVKYTDRFSTRRVDLLGNRKYHDLAEASPLWADARRALSDQDVSQLLRCHALGTIVGEADFGATKCTLVLIAHPLDTNASVGLARYRDHLADPNSALEIPIDRFLNAARETAADLSELFEVTKLDVRYLRHDLSEHLWLQQVQSGFQTPSDVPRLS